MQPTSRFFPPQDSWARPVCSLVGDIAGSFLSTSPPASVTRIWSKSLSSWFHLDALLAAGHSILFLLSQLMLRWVIWGTWRIWALWADSQPGSSPLLFSPSTSSLIVGSLSPACSCSCFHMNSLFLVVHLACQPFLHQLPSLWAVIVFPVIMILLVLL